MEDLRGVLSAGIQLHELGHDQYGGIFKLPESIRNQVIGDAVAKGLGGEGSKMVDVPGHGQMSLQDLCVSILKAQADENTADILDASWSGANSGSGLGLHTQSLRKDGLLLNASVMGKEMATKDNPLGFEKHGIDKWRIRLMAEQMRARSNGDAKVLADADSLDNYSKTASRPGDYVFASIDHPGQSLVIKENVFDSLIKPLIEAQNQTKLTALNNNAFENILPDLPKLVNNMDQISDLMYRNIKSGNNLSSIKFDKNSYLQLEVFGAGLPTAARLVGEGMDPDVANAKVNQVSDYLQSLYADGNPHIEQLSTTTIQSLKLKPLTTLTRGIANVVGMQPVLRQVTEDKAAFTGGMCHDNNVQ